MGELLTRIGLPPNFMEDDVAFSTRRAGMPCAWIAFRSLLAISDGSAGSAPRPAAWTARTASCCAPAAGDAEAPARGSDWSAPAELVAPTERGSVLFRNNTFWLFFVSVMGMAVRNALLRRWVERRAGDVPFNDLIRGLTGLRSLEPMHGIGRLAELARQLPHDVGEDLSWPTRMRSERVWTYRRRGEKLLAEVEAFMECFGFLSSNGSDFTASTWAENPTLIWRAVARARRQP